MQEEWEQCRSKEIIPYLFLSFLFSCLIYFILSYLLYFFVASLIFHRFFSFSLFLFHRSFSSRRQASFTSWTKPSYTQEIMNCVTASSYATCTSHRSSYPLPSVTVSLPSTTHTPAPATSLLLVHHYHNKHHRSVLERTFLGNCSCHQVRTRPSHWMFCATL